MMERAEGSPNGKVLVRMPMSFQRRGGRRRIVPPDGSTIASAIKLSQTAPGEGAGAGVAVAADA
jgi:hypothetical protein